MSHVKEIKILEEISIDGLSAFLTSNLKKFSWIIVLYFGLSFYILYLMIHFIFASDGDIFFSLLKLLFGVLLSLLILPLHEFVHGLVYKMAGAQMIRYDWDVLNLQFLTVAPDFAVSRNQFLSIAAAPLVIIGSFIILLLFISEGYTGILLGALWGHIAWCSGDIGMINYLSRLPQEDTFAVYNQSKSVLQIGFR